MKAKKFYRKIVKNGNSFAFNIPKEWIEETQAQLGDLYEMVQKDGKLIIQKVTPPHDNDFLRALEDSYQQYEEALRELRDR
jgi:putative addiction module antidote